MLTHRTIRPDFHAWWQGWALMLVLVGLIGWAGSCFQDFQAERRSNAEYRRAVREGRTPEDEEKLKARAKYLEAAAEAARRGPPHYTETIEPGQTMEWLDVKRDAPFERFEGWYETFEPQGAKFRYFWVGSGGSRGFVDYPENAQRTWEEAIRHNRQRGENTAKFRIENRDARPITINVWWIDGERPRKTRRSSRANRSHDAANSEQPTEQRPRSIPEQERAQAESGGGSWMPKYMREGFQKSARKREATAAAPHGETWSGTVVAVLNGPELEIAGENGTRTIDCGRAVIYFGEDERKCLDVNAGDVVVVTYPENAAATIKVSVVARPANQ